MSLRHVRTVAAMHARDLARRRLALAILVLLPLAFYFSAEMTPVDPEIEQVLAADPARRAEAELWIVATGAMGAAWAIAVATLFVIIGSRRADQPLLLAGFRPNELLAGRVLTVAGFGAVVTPLFALVIWSQREIDLGLLAAAIAVAEVVAVAIGVVAAALVPREMEGVLVIIGVIGIQMSGDAQSWMPLWGSGQLIQRAAGLPDAAASGEVAFHAGVFSAVLLAVGVVLWSRRTRLRPPTRLLPVGGRPSAGSPSPTGGPA